MKIFLQGGGGKEDSLELDKKFIHALDLSKPLLYIPIAMDTKIHSYSSCLAWISDALAPLGVTSIIMWVEEDLKGKNINDFEQFSGIYIGGGNTFKLLKEMKDYGTFEILTNLARKNIPIYGGSAGALILSRTIITALYSDDNSVGLTDFSAMNLVHNYDLWCHYVPEVYEEIIGYKNKYNLEKVIALPENAGLYITDIGIEEVGPGRVCYI